MFRSWSVASSPILSWVPWLSGGLLLTPMTFPTPNPSMTHHLIPDPTDALQMRAAAAGWPAAQVVPGGCDYRLPEVTSPLRTLQSPRGWMDVWAPACCHAQGICERKQIS